MDPYSMVAATSASDGYVIGQPLLQADGYYQPHSAGELVTDPHQMNGHSFVIPDGGYGVLGSVLVSKPYHYPVTSVVFDNQEELLWTGNSGGYVTSYYGPSMSKYTAFRVHMSEEVRCIHTTDTGVLSLTRHHLRCNTRFGLIASQYTADNFEDMQCMLKTSNDELIIGGHQSTVVLFDLNKFEQIREFKIKEAGCAILRSDDKFIYSGDVNGKIALRDPKSLDAVHVLDAHPGTLSDFDVYRNKLVSCGFSIRMDHLQCDRFLMVYDLRTFRALPPVPIPFDPMLLRFSTLYSDARLIVASQSGQFQALEIGAATTMQHLYQINSGGMSTLCMDISSTKQCLAFGDNGGLVHLFGDKEVPTFNTSSRPTEFADPPPVLPPMAIHEDTFPMSSIPLPRLASGSTWLSDWPDHLCRRVYRKRLPIEQVILDNMRVVQFVGYAPNPGTRRRNQVPYDLTHNSSDSGHDGSPSDLLRGHGNDSVANGRSGDLHAGDAGMCFSIPRIYRRANIKLVSILASDFDYRLYNKTSYSGVEFHQPNAYTKAVILALNHLHPVRAAVRSHLCRKEFCLACEMSFLFEMLRRAGGRCPVLANNFIRAFRTIPEAPALGLVLLDRADLRLQKPDLEHLIQSFHRFLMRQLIVELSDSQKSCAPLYPNINSLRRKTGGYNLSRSASTTEASSSRTSRSTEDTVNASLDNQETPASTRIHSSSITSDENPNVSERSRLSSEPGLSEDTKDVVFAASASPPAPAPISGIGLPSEDPRTGPEHELDRDHAIDDTSLCPRQQAPSGTSNGEINTNYVSAQTTAIDNIFGFEIVNLARCRCGDEAVRTDSSVVVPLAYPVLDTRAAGDDSATSSSSSATPFSNIVQRSLYLKNSTQAWCDRCQKFQLSSQCKRAVSLPDVLVLSCHIETNDDLEFWDRQLHLAATSAFRPFPAGFGGSMPPPTGAVLPDGSVLKLCRYRSSCTRPNCRFLHEGELGFRNGHSWLPLMLHVDVSDGEVVVSEDFSSSLAESFVCTGVKKIYQLTAVVCAIRDGTEVPHLITSARVPSAIIDMRGSENSTPEARDESASVLQGSDEGESGGDADSNHRERSETPTVENDSSNGTDGAAGTAGNGRQNPSSSGSCISPMTAANLKTRDWIIYNDIMVSYVDGSEVTHFSMDWKIPCLLYYSAIDIKDTPTASDDIVKIEESALFEDECLATRRRLSSSTCIPLESDEIPRKNHLVAIDAEFVTLNQEESELRSDGSKSTIRASMMAVARVTCIRGSGPLEGTPFIDDYISTQEEIADYLTDYSGIKPGDLDAEVSSKHLTTLKTTYLKLRYLVDAGVIFVGHGLKNDFRMINMIVPEEQMIDTVQLFHLPHHRMVSLRFLAWHFLSIKIQGDTHDSVEDARTALRLYRKYQQLAKNGPAHLTRMLTEMYDNGRKLKWKIPIE